MPLDDLDSLPRQLFPARHLKPYAEPVCAGDLREGSTYFAVTYADGDLLIPLVESLVFIGRDLDNDGEGQLYFQEVTSYRKGIRYAGRNKGPFESFSLYSDSCINHIFDFEHALEQLMLCSLRRQAAGE